MNILSKQDFNNQFISVITHEQNVYQQIEKLVELIKIAHEKKWDDAKDNVFKTLVQLFFPYLCKASYTMYRFDPLIDKRFPAKILWLKETTPLLPEHYISVIGLLWEIVMKYDSSRGVYFTHFMEKNFIWYYKKLSRTRLRKKKYKGRPNDDYKLVSYEELTEKKEDNGEHTYGIAKIGDMAYDDNFDVITFEWSLREPQEFVDNNALFEAASSFTTKQMEVFSLELEGYKQEQIADEVRTSGVQITQQGVNERLLGVRKKIDKINKKRGVSYEREKSSNHPA